MSFLDKIQEDISNIFLNEFAETIQDGNGNSYKAIVTVSTSAEYDGKRVKDTARFAIATKLPYGTILNTNWRVESIVEQQGLYLHYCSKNERLAYGR